MTFGNLPQRKCENCGQPFTSGRSDRRFCNDSCRNTFNRQKRVSEKIKDYENLPEIFKLIKSNHEILKSYDLYSLSRHEHKTAYRNTLEKKGFSFKYFTSVHRDLFGTCWNCCFDFGWREISDSEVLMAYIPEEIEIGGTLLTDPKRQSDNIRKQ